MYKYWNKVKSWQLVLLNSHAWDSINYLRTLYEIAITLEMRWSSKIGILSRFHEKCHYLFLKLEIVNSFIKSIFRIFGYNMKLFWKWPLKISRSIFQLFPFFRRMTSIVLKTVVPKKVIHQEENLCEIKIFLKYILDHSVSISIKNLFEKSFFHYFDQ